MMKMQNVPLTDVVPNPWRDMKLYPIDTDHVAELRESIDDHGFFGGIKGRRRNGKVETACGHMRVAAARKAKLDSIPIFIEDMDDDQMLRLMTDENATQAGSNPGAVLNEVAAITRRLIEGIVAWGNNCCPAVKAAFKDKGAMDRAIGKLRNGSDVHLALGEDSISRYLGQGNPDRSHRGLRQIREAISTLKQSGRYDDMVEEAVRKHAPVTDKSSKSTTVATSKQPTRRTPVLDDRCANLFPNEHQFHAFREAITTEGAKKVIPVDQQYKLAKQIMDEIKSQPKKHVGAPFIRKRVQHEVERGMRAQRDLDKAEKEAYLRDQREARIESELHSANASVRSLVSAIARLIDLAGEFPRHPKLGGFSARLDTLVDAIKQFSKKLK